MTHSATRRPFPVFRPLAVVLPYTTMTTRSTLALLAVAALTAACGGKGAEATTSAAPAAVSVSPENIAVAGRTTITRDRKSTRLKSSHTDISRMPSSA